MRPEHQTRQTGAGFVMIIVLWILAVMTVITLGFGHRAYLDARAAAHGCDIAQAQAMARGAIWRGMIELRHQELFQRALRAWLDQNPGLAPLYEEQLERRSPFQTYDTRDSYEHQFEGPYEHESCTVTIEDEERRFSINTMPREILEEIPWFDASDFSDILEENRIFVTLEELREIDDIDDEAWIGNDEKPGIRDLLTVYGDGRININTASRVVLELIPDFDGSIVDEIEQFCAGDDAERGTADDRAFNAVDELSAMFGISAEDLEPLRRYCKTDSGFYRIIGIATRRNGRVRATCTAVCAVTRNNQTSKLEFTVIHWREEVSGS